MCYILYNEYCQGNELRVLYICFGYCYTVIHTSLTLTTLTLRYRLLYYTIHTRGPYIKWQFTTSLVEKITVLLSIRQLAVAVDVGQPGQPLVQLGRPLAVELGQGDAGGHFAVKIFHIKNWSLITELISDGKQETTLLLALPPVQHNWALLALEIIFPRSELRLRPTYRAVCLQWGRRLSGPANHDNKRL